MCLNELVKRAWELPGSVYWFVSPVFDQAKVQFKRLETMLGSCPGILAVAPNKTELRFTFINGSQIRFVSGETGQRLRGETLHGAVIDEVRDQPPEIWGQVVRPMLTTTKGWCAFVSTPSGFDSFYDLAERARIDPEWEFFHAPSTCNPLFTEEEFQAAKKEMSEAEFAQEILAEFRDIHSGSAYVNFSEANCSVTNPFYPHRDRLYSEYLPVIIGLDFNVKPIAWVMAQQRGEVFYFFDEIFIKTRTNTHEASIELVARLKQLSMRHKPQVILAGDSTGSATKTVGAGKSDYAIVCQALDEAGITYEDRTPSENPRVKDRINTMNAKLCSADGGRNIFLHPKNCPNLKKDFQRVTWKQGATFVLDQTTDPMLTHISDAAGYAVCALSSMWEPSAGGLKIIRRT